jgi:hypothetical protein
VILDGDAHLVEMRHHAGADLIQLILGRDGMVTAVPRDVMSVPALVAVPVGFEAFDGVAGAIDAIFVADAVEDVELELGSPAAFVGDPRGAHIFLGANGNVARVVGKALVCIGFEGAADEAEGGRLPEGIEERRLQVRDEDHVPGFDRFEAHRGAVEADAFLHQFGLELARRDSEVVPAPPQVAKLQVDHFDAMFGDKMLRLLERFKHRLSLQKDLCLPTIARTSRSDKCRSSLFKAKTRLARGTFQKMLNSSHRERREL